MRVPSFRGLYRRIGCQVCGEYVYWIVLNAQRLWRGYSAVKEARIEVISIMWDEMAAEMAANRKKTSSAKPASASGSKKKKDKKRYYGLLLILGTMCIRLSKSI
jgi:hypothetical protein